MEGAKVNRLLEECKVLCPFGPKLYGYLALTGYGGTVGGEGEEGKVGVLVVVRFSNSLRGIHCGLRHQDFDRSSAITEARVGVV